MLMMVVDPDGLMSKIDAKPSLDVLQGLVGGYIELIQLGDFNIYLNEEGKLMGLDPNPRAEDVLRAFDINLNGDRIVGRAVFTGPLDEHFYDTDFPFELLDKRGLDFDIN